MEKTILKLFLFNHKLKFNEIEKLLNIKSNKLAYHLKNFVKKGMLNKNEDYYTISKNFEYILPYLSNKMSVLPIILIHIGDSKKAFLYKRKKRPYYNKLSLPGGRLYIGESIKDAVNRIMYDKFKINVKLNSIKSISLEHTIKDKRKINSFLLILTSASQKKDSLIKLIDINKNKSDIISSDYKLIKQKPKEIPLSEFYTKI